MALCALGCIQNDMLGFIADEFVSHSLENLISNKVLRITFGGYYECSQSKNPFLGGL